MHTGVKDLEVYKELPLKGASQNQIFVAIELGMEALSNGLLISKTT